MTDNSQLNSNNRRMSGATTTALLRFEAECDALALEPEMITASFAVTAETVSDVGLAALPEVEAVAHYISPDLLALALAKRNALHDDAKKNGKIAQENRAKDLLRKGEGRADYNMERRLGYAHRIEANGGVVGPYGKSTPESLKEQDAEAKARKRARMTPEQKKLESAARSERRRVSKAAAKALAQAEIDARTKF